MHIEEIFITQGDRHFGNLRVPVPIGSDNQNSSGHSSGLGSRLSAQKNYFLTSNSLGTTEMACLSLIRSLEKDLAHLNPDSKWVRPDVKFYRH